MKNTLIQLWCLLVALSLPLSGAAQLRDTVELNGFDLSDISVAQEDIFQGGPPREGIPAIDAPKFINAAEAEFLKADDRLLGVVIDGVARAYPIRILNWHEIVNDKIGETAFSVTYCPLCGSGMVFSGDMDGRELNFGVSGLIFDNNVLLYDRNTQSLWSQVMGQAISGEFKGSRLQWLPVTHTTWAAWKKLHPNTEVLSTETGFARDYTDNPYELYEQVGMIYFPRRNISPNDYKAHEVVLGVQVNGVYKAYPHSEMARQNLPEFDDVVNGRQLTITWDKVSRSASVKDQAGRQLPSMVSYWFAWYSFYPDAGVFKIE